MATMDFAQDLVDHLEGSGAVYLLVVGMPGDSGSMVYENMVCKGNFEKAIRVLEEVMERKYP